MARPCPFYILDEVEAALDDINIDRFLRLVRRFAERSQFIVVTHQKRTMDAADILYGVSMGGDGITKVVSRKLPRDELGTGLEPTAGSVADGDGGPPAAAEAPKLAAWLRAGKRPSTSAIARSRRSSWARSAPGCSGGCARASRAAGRR